MNLKPARQYSEFDVLPYFALNTATGSKGTPVVISNSGVNTNNSTPTVHSNLAAGLNKGNTYSPRWEIYPRVRAAVSGEKPIGITLYDTLENNQFNYPLLYDKQRREELQAVLSGQAVPILCKGVVTVGPFAAGETPHPSGKFLAVKGTGDLGVTTLTSGTSGVAPANAFGRFLGSKDSDGYAMVQFDCNL